MEDILDIQQWTENWINDMHLAVGNRDKGLIMVLLQENNESEVDWSDDVQPSVFEEYNQLINQAYKIVL